MYPRLVLGMLSILATTLGGISAVESRPANAKVPSPYLAALPAAVSTVSTGDETRPPIGWVQFCRDYKADCSLNESEAEVITLTPQVWRTLQKINLGINKSIQPVTDMEHHGVPELWSYPIDGKGDCEDYALFKRQQLSLLGLPRRALLMTVVIDEQGGHAVLTVRTNRGDFILDNKRNAILAWDSTGYRFVKREAQHKGGWVSLGDPGPAVATAGR
jgi:predicted transglutaminase-like cysteine proteinase